MANEAYRAVFLRVHPTGKMVLSLTTEADGREPEYAELVARGLGVPPLDVKVVPADENRFGAGHGFNVVLPGVGGNVCVYAINLGAGANTALGCRSLQRVRRSTWRTRSRLSPTMHPTWSRVLGTPSARPNRSSMTRRSCSENDASTPSRCSRRAWVTTSSAWGVVAVSSIRSPRRAFRRPPD